MIRVPGSLWAIVSVFKPRRAYTQAVRTFALYVGRSTQGLLDLHNEAVSEKPPEICRLSLPAEYVTAFTGRTDAPEVRCDITDRQTETLTQLP